MLYETKRRMDPILIGIVLICVIVILYYGSQEHMTNADLLDTLKTFGNQTPSKKKTTPTSLPIEGPEAKTPEPSSSSSSSGKSKNDSALYPQIYGPDVPMTPGKKQHTGKHVSDNTDDSNYDFNPNFQRAFPTDGPPQPFLGDFSKFQR